MLMDAFENSEPFAHYSHEVRQIYTKKQTLIQHNTHQT